MSWESEGHLNGSEQVNVRDSGIWDILRQPVEERLGEELHYVRVNKVRKVEGESGGYLEVGIRVYYEALWEQYRLTDIPAGRFYLRLDHENAWGMPEGDAASEPLRRLLGELAVLHGRDLDLTPSQDAPLLTSPPMLLAEAVVSGQEAGGVPLTLTASDRTELAA